MDTLQRVAGLVSGSVGDSPQAQTPPPEPASAGKPASGEQPPASRMEPDGHGRGALWISDAMLDRLVDQANKELQSSNYYLTFSLWFEDRELPGSAAWCRHHSEEERSHALKIFDHLIKRRAKGIMLQPLEAVRVDFKDPVEVWEAASAQERDNSASIFSIMKLARQTDDYTSEELLRWYISEQMEEEAAVNDILTNAREIVKTQGLYRDYDAKIAKKKH
ncbi:ferritin-like superfamily [Hyaloraphidium curvatum]|nr:ferritin-like superfamily [Hyaloraphidium curvatum]